MRVLKTIKIPIANESDVVTTRQVVRKIAIEQKFSLTDQTKLVTAVSEIARNTLIYGLGGDARVDVLENEGRLGISVAFIDQGPGIANLDQALTDGYTSGNGLGLGLSGSKRLVHEFIINSKLGEGTEITLVRWK
jgi:serine/threonine-protein kinase RsbT